MSGRGAAFKHGPRGPLGLGVIVQQVRRARLGRLPFPGDLGVRLREQVRAAGVAEKLNGLPVEDVQPLIANVQE